MLFARWLFVVIPLVALAGCESEAKRDADAAIINVSYDPTRELYQEVNAAFVQDAARLHGKIQVVQSHGGSGAQARAVIDGLAADVVTLALAGDIDALARKGLLAKNWENRLPNHSSPYTSTIVMLVRKGNPKGIKDWADLARSDVKILTPNPKTSGGARWNFLAAWGAVTIGKKGTDIEATDFVRKVYQNIVKLDTGARSSMQSFVKNKLGDVLVSWENDAILVAREVPELQLEIIYPSISILAEPPVAVVDKNVDERGTRQVAEAYVKFLYTDAAQDIIGKNAYRPTNPAFQKKYAHMLPNIPMFTIREVAGDWPTAHEKFFSQGGVFDQIYHR